MKLWQGAYRFIVYMYATCERSACQPTSLSCRSKQLLLKLVGGKQGETEHIVRGITLLEIASHTRSSNVAR